MIDRLILQELLENVLDSKNVYYQEPPNKEMKYPCIVYRFERFNRQDADNTPYILNGRWVIHHMFKKVSDDTLKEKLIREFKFCEFDRRIIKDGIYNDYYTLNI